VRVIFCDQDKEDAEQERKILEWAKSADKQITLTHINQSGTISSSLCRGSFSLDEATSTEERSGTYADIIAGSDGRELYDDDPDRGYEQILDRADDLIRETLRALSFKEMEIEWLNKMWCSLVKSEDKLFQTLMIDSEWESL
jgi:hypothetical protein